MKLSLVAFYLVCAVALCSAKPGPFSEGPFSGKLADPKNVSVFVAEIVSNGMGVVQKRNMIGGKKQSPATPEVINSAMSALVKTWPRAEKIFDNANTDIEELISKTDPTKKDKAKVYGGLLQGLRTTDNVVRAAYAKYNVTLNRILTSGVSWEFQNNRLWHLIFVVSAEINKTGGKKPEEEECIKALHADVQGIRDEIKWIAQEVSSEQLEKDELPHPVEVVKEIAIIEYMSKKIDREIVQLFRGVIAMFSFLNKPDTDKPDKPTPPKNQVLSTLHSLIDEIFALKRSRSNGIQKALEKEKERKDFLTLGNDEEADRKRRSVLRETMKANRK